MKHAIALVISILIVFCLGALAADGFDEAEADRQDKEARAELAGIVMCGPKAAPDWLDDKTMRCLKHVDQPPHLESEMSETFTTRANEARQEGGKACCEQFNKERA